MRVFVRRIICLSILMVSAGWTGFAYGADYDTTVVAKCELHGDISPNDAYQMALDLIRRKALGQASEDVYVQKSYYVEEREGKFKDQFFKWGSSVQHAIITQMQVIDSGLTNNEFYLKMRVSVHEDEPDGPSPYEIDIMNLNRDYVYEAGDPLKLDFDVKSDANVYIFSINYQHRKAFFQYPLPYPPRRPIIIAGGSKINFPDSLVDYEMHMYPLQGESMTIEEMRVITTAPDRPLLFSRSHLKADTLYAGYEPLLYVDLEVLEKQLAKFPFEKRGMASVTYTIKAKKDDNE